MAEFWEQQLMDRMMALCFEYKDSEKQSMPTERVRDIIDYVKYLVAEKEKELND